MTRATAAALDALGAREVSASTLPDGLAQRAVDGATGWLSRRTSRRGFFLRAGVIGSALAVDWLGFALKPGTAYAAVCGPGSSCSSGWTVFCATLNKGANTCPPNSIAAGWWKSDGASLCGGNARYIVDCNSVCRCTSGRAGICSPSCWSCSCSCGPSWSCDQRRVCCNAFRYGQCNQQVGQVGAIVCRVVSCTPPWKWANCSTAPATDNATRDHNSDFLPQAWTPLTARHVALGEQASVLGSTVGGEFGVKGAGRAQRYERGRISWASPYGAVETVAQIANLYVALGAEAGILGFPMRPPQIVGPGRASSFERGRISWHPTIGVRYTQGPIAARYSTLGNEGSLLGWTIADPFVPRDGRGRASRFERGRLTWHPDLGPVRLLGLAISDRYRALAGEPGPLGYPVEDELAVPGDLGRSARFQHGRISWSSTTGAFEVMDDLAAAFGRAGNEAGVLGFPVEAQQAVTGGRVSRLQRGRISWSPVTSAHWTRGPITDAYVAAGAEAGSYGFPVADEVTVGVVRTSKFQHGSISYDESTGIITTASSN